MRCSRADQPVTCQQCRERGAELALNVLPARERAGVLAHLDACAGCRDTVSAMTVTADRLVELLPGAEPPVGFEHRVLTALAPAPMRARRRWVPAAVAVLAIALAGGGWIVGRGYHDVPRPETDSQAGLRTIMFAPLITGDRPVGHAYVYPGRDPWIYLFLDDAVGDIGGTVRCELVRRDGSATPVGTFTLSSEHRAWATPIAVDGDTLAAARLINGSGDTVAIAHFDSHE
ncbi:MAG TPA: hypothetical protein VN748_10450 [Pseudonocardiaceae bacterium]|nr:hypothetical protein [Pseudonocardiaceae bacterium]